MVESSLTSFAPRSIRRRARSDFPLPPRPSIITARPLTDTVLLCSISEDRSEEHTSELQSLMRILYAVFCSKKNILHHLNDRFPRPTKTTRIQSIHEYNYRTHTYTTHTHITTH